MTQIQVVETLKKEIDSNPVVSDVLHVFAMRKRTRAVVTLHSLVQRMKNAGFNHERSEYITVLKVLANIGLGKLDVDSRGKVRALKDIKTTLQSIGQAAIQQADNLVNFHQRNKFHKINPEVIGLRRVAPTGTDVSLKVLINGKEVSVSLSKELTPEEIGTLVSKFQG